VPPPPPPRGKAGNGLEPPAVFHITASTTRLRHPALLRSVTSTRIMSFPVLTATVTVSPGAPEPPG